MDRVPRAKARPSKPTRTRQAGSAARTGDIISHRMDVTLLAAPIARYPYPHRSPPPEIRVAQADAPKPRRPPTKLSACPHRKATAPSPSPLPPPLRSRGGRLAGTGGEGNAAAPPAVPGRGAAAPSRVGARAPRAVRRLPRLGRAPPGLHRCVPFPSSGLASLRAWFRAMREGFVSDGRGFPGGVLVFFAVASGAFDQEGASNLVWPHMAASAVSLAKGEFLYPQSPARLDLSCQREFSHAFRPS